jgi:hypothetical protein
MSERDGIGEILQRLSKIRTTMGEEAYEDAMYAVAVELYRRPHGGEALVLDTFPDIEMDLVQSMVYPKEIEDLTSMARQPEPKQEAPTQDMMMLNMMRQQMPNLKTQAQFNTFMLAFDALRGTLNAYFGGETAAAEVARDVLNKSLDMAAKVTGIAESLKDIPEDQRSDQSNMFTAPAAQLHEYDEQRSLLLELGNVKTFSELQKWYLETKPRRDSIVSQNLRNELLDAIRHQKEELSKLQ